MRLIFFLVVGVSPLVLVSSSNILFYFPAVNFSQRNAIWPLVQALAGRGHNVTFFSPIADSASTPNITSLAPAVLQNMVKGMYALDRFAQREAGLAQVFDYVGATKALCDMVMGENRKTDPVIQALFSKDTKFDLVVVNSAISDCGFLIAKYFDAKTINYSPSVFYPFFYDTYGVPGDGGWIPDIMFIARSVPMSFLERVYSTLTPLYWHWVRSCQLSPVLEKLAEPLFEGRGKVPSLYELEQNVSLVLLNTHVAADYARAMSPLFVDVGGMSLWKPEKELPQQFKDFMDAGVPTPEGDGGVVLITFGSTVLLNTVSERHQAMFFQLVTAFPKVRFILRWEGPLPRFLGEEPPKNLLISKWLPQREILGHPNLRAFITHGGISSVHEATYYGVPLIVLPLFADQDLNAYRVQTQEVGIRVEIQGMTGDTLVQALDQVLKDKKFKDNVEQKSAIFRNRPQSPVDTALFWTEFALKHNNTMKTFRPGNAHLNPAQYRSWDVYSFLVVIFLAAAHLAVLLIKTLINGICFLVNKAVAGGCCGGDVKRTKKVKRN